MKKDLSNQIDATEGGQFLETLPRGQNHSYLLVQLICSTLATKYFTKIVQYTILLRALKHLSSFSAVRMIVLTIEKEITSCVLKHAETDISVIH